jgi:fumarate reductase subunit D
MRPSNEPLFWAIFSAGGMITALLIPILIVVTGFLVPAETIEFDALETLFGNGLVRLIVLGVAFVTFFHAAHRIRHTLKDMGLHSLAKPIAGASYLAAAFGTIWAAVVVAS